MSNFTPFSFLNPETHLLAMLSSENLVLYAVTLSFPSWRHHLWHHLWAWNTPYLADASASTPRARQGKSPGILTWTAYFESMVRRAAKSVHTCSNP